MDKNCDNCIHSGRPSYEYPCTACETAYGAAPSKWEGMAPATADMVEVVRCKDCEHYNPQKKSAHWENRANYCNRVVTIKVKPDDFCSYGERKDCGSNG